MADANTLGFTLTLLAIVSVAGAALVQQFLDRPFEPKCATCSRRHAWGQECAPRRTR